MVTEQKLITQASAIALALGDSWTSSIYNERCFGLQRSDGLALHIRVDHRQRLQIKGDWGELDNFLLNGYDTQRWGKITVSAEGSSQAIAKQINRRLLPQIIPVWESATQKYNQYQNRKEQKTALTQKLANILRETHLETRLNADGNRFTYSGSDRFHVECYCPSHGGGCRPQTWQLDPTAS